MRRLVLIPILASLLVVAVASSSQAAFYLGHGKGIRVAFRTKGSKLVWADVFVRLYCANPDGRRHLNPFRLDYATAEDPLGIDSRGVFRWKTPGGIQEEGFEEEEELVGHVGRRAITGSFEYRFSLSTANRRVRCQTGTFPFRNKRIEFRAPLRPGHR